MGEALQKGLYFLSQLTDLDVDWLLTAGTTTVVPEGELLLRQGLKSDEIIIIIDGEVRVFDPTTGSDYAVLTAGELLGEVSFVDQSPSSASVVAATDTTVFRLPGARLREKVDRDGAFSGRFHAMVAGFLSGRLRSVIDQGSLLDQEPGAEHPNLALARARLSRLMHRLSPISRVRISGQDLTIEDLVRVARHRARCEVTDHANNMLHRSRRVVEDLANGETPIYGINTSLGALKDIRIGKEDISKFQHNVLRSHAVAIQPEHPQETVRAIMLARLNGMARGGAGIDPAVFHRLLDFLNADVIPVVPSKGSVGMSDLAPLAHLALPLIGDGEVWYRGKRMPSSKALSQIGFSPLTLGPKDALSLISANSAATGQGALAIFDTINLLTNADIAAALSIEAFQANLSPLDERMLPVRPHEGQIITTLRLRSMLEGSSRHDLDAPKSLQDPISFRCVAQVHGPCHELLALARRVTETELNSSGDNPVVLPDHGEIISNGNFHPSGLALSLDSVAMALAQACSMSAGRTVRLNDDSMTGLPPQLAPNPGINCGLGLLQKTVTALNAEARFLASPGSLDFISIAGSIEDHSTMATFVATKLENQVRTVEHVIAIELLTAAQAIDLRNEIRLGVGTQAAYRTIREHLSLVDEDRIIAPDIERLQKLIHDGTIVRAVAEATETEFGSAL